MQFAQCLWLEVFVEKDLSHLKNTPNTVTMEMCHVDKLWTSFGQAFRKI